MQGFNEYKKEDVEKYTRIGAWMGITLSEMLRKAADVHDNKEAVVDDTFRLTYSQLCNTVDRLAIGLIKLGINKGDSVLLQLPNQVEFVCSLFAILRIGAIAVLLLPRYRQIEINHLCSLTAAKAWIVPEKHRETNYLPVIDEVTRANKQLKHVILVRASDASSFASIEKLIQDAGLNKANLSELDNRRPEPTDVAIVFPTGGTTGLPKAAPRTHNDAICEANFKSRAREQDNTDICLFVIPIEHNLALAAMNGTLFSRGKIVLLDSTNPTDFCATAQRERVMCAPLVPALLTRVLNFEHLKAYDMSSLRRLYVGGEKTTPEIIKSVHEKIGHVYITAFGMVEGPTCTTRLSDPSDIIFNTIGKPCCPYDEFKVIDQNGEDLPVGAEGELVAKGPGVFSGYLNSPEENARAFTKDGFFRTGDLATIDTAGNIKITGRIKDIINRGGENINPGEIEQLILTHPDVENASVIGVPDKELGERICAYVSLRIGKKLEAQDIISFLKSKGASVLQVPERVEFIDSIPLTKLGKTDKKALREDIKKRLGLC